MGNQKLTISIGKSRRETRWRIVNTTWDALAERLTDTTRTRETMAEYAAASPDRRAEIKDIGGFVGGAVEGGRRVRGSVLKRSLLTLDLDNPPAELDFHTPTDILGCNAVLYSTHSHTEDAPRLRLVAPLSREVSPDEYEALARKVAETIGIDFFDDTTYQCERLMYWPSTPTDGDFISTIITHQEALDVDKWLGRYHDWRDISQWPVSSRQADIVRHDLRKQQDPHDKPGIVGAFCRTFSIAEAIAEFLPEVYTATDDPNRYTYARGTSALGLVIYEDKFAYSHHATDPVGGKLCNAFDLVRGHRFGHLDEKAKPDTPANKLPSYGAMAELANATPSVAVRQREEAEEREALMLEDFTADTDRPKKKKTRAAQEDEWLSLLKRNKEGNCHPTYENIDTILLRDPRLRGLFCYDQFHTAVMLTRPFETHDTLDRYTDTDVSNVKSYLERAYGMKNGGGEKVRERIEATARVHQFHPVRDYLDSLEWDGIPRLDTLFIDYNGAEDNELTRCVTRITLTAAVARIYEPGCKFDYVLTLQGQEATGKSTIIRRLGLDKWNKEGLASMGADRSAAEQLPGSWLIEVSELAAMRRNEVEEVKAFVSTCVDTYRPAYGRSVESYPRQCIFIATTNETDFLKGTTGNRRFWIVQCLRRENPDRTPDNLDRQTVGQIWAEAIAAYRAVERDDNGAPLLKLPRHLEAEMRIRQESFSEFADDERRGMIEDYLDAWVDEDEMASDFRGDTAPLGHHRRDRVCIRQILTQLFHMNPESPQGKYERKIIKKLVEGIEGWEERGRIRIRGFGVVRGYVRTSSWGKKSAEEKPENLDNI